LLPALESIEADGAAVLRVAAQLDPIVLGGGSADGKEEDHDPFEDHSEEEADDDDHGHEEHGEEEADDDHGRDDDDAHEDDESDEEHSKGEGHDHDHAGGMDPHFWLDMDRMADAAELIGEELQSIAGGGFEVCGDQIGEKIESAERSVIEILDSVPEGQRVLVTDHDALEYFAQRYGYTVAGVVIPGGSTLGEPNSQELATLVGVIQDRDVPAIFGNNALGQDVLDVVAGEVGRDVQVVSLFIGSLGGPDSEATTYVQMMTTNATLIAQALRD
jgi:zinc/manganese transport system substrate-binding protein